MCPPADYYSDPARPTTCILLPSFQQIERLTASDVPELIEKFINPGPTNTTPLETSGKDYSSVNPIESQGKEATDQEAEDKLSRKEGKKPEISGQAPLTEPTLDPQIIASTDDAEGLMHALKLTEPTPAGLDDTALERETPSSYLTAHECPHDYLILLCSHKRRDGKTATG